MLPYLQKDTPFPPLETALDEPNGLLAAGGDLSSQRMLNAYSHGIFPWYGEEEPILWWSPDPRTVFFIEQFKIRKSVKKALRQLPLTITLNRAFKSVIRECAKPRSETNGTWIVDEMIASFVNLHRLGRAHSIEVWLDQDLVGGIYGINVGGVFCGESMFSKISNGSKIALTCLCLYLKQFGIKLIDCQLENPHLMSLGATNIPREEYLERLTSNLNLVLPSETWREKELNWRKLIMLDSR